MKTLKTLLLCILSLLVISANAQTNPPASDRLKVISKALNQYFQIDKDIVDDTKTISMTDYDELENTGTARVNYDLVAFIFSTKKLPDKISLHLRSHSENWRFLDSHDFMIRYGDIKLTVGNLSYANKVLDDGTVFETIWPDFTLEQFHDIAFAGSVFIKFGYKNYEITSAQRRKWKLLWTFLDLKHNESDALQMFEADKSYTPPPLTQEEIDAQNAEKSKADAKTKAVEQKQAAVARALQANQDAAAKGDAYGLMRMGERYRDGEGVEKDLAKAKEYLQKAADAGSPTAKDDLSKLNSLK